MKRATILITILTISLAAIVFAACGGGAQSVNNSAKAAVTNTNLNASASDPSKLFNVEFKSEPSDILAGTPTELTFTVKDKQGATVKDMQIVHEKPMHLIAVSKDLNEFYHIHPEPQPDGSYKVTHTFPNGGDYRLYADFTPVGAAQDVEQIDVRVGGPQRASVELVPDSTFEKTVDGLKVVMTPSVPLKAGQELTLDFRIFDATSGKPAADLQNYLGELAHFVLISQDLKDYVHVHPMSKGESMDSMNMGEGKMDDQGSGNNHSKMDSKASESRSEVSAHTAFPRPGLYKVWAQFQRNNKVISVPFVVNVADFGIKTAKNDPDVPAGAVGITVSSSGFMPASLNVKKGEPVKLAFFRKDGNNCASKVMFSALNIKKDLPVGETVVVEFTPRVSGEITFSCGMGMMKGKVLVN